MLNDRDDKFEGQGPEESEYHFSDDDISYEVDAETAAPGQSVPVSPKANFFTKLTAYRRMLISGVVFLVLIFIVYKMVSPSGTVQTTEIAPTGAQALSHSAEARSTPHVQAQTLSQHTTPQLSPASNLQMSPPQIAAQAPQQPISQHIMPQAAMPQQPMLQQPPMQPQVQPFQQGYYPQSMLPTQQLPPQTIPQPVQQQMPMSQMYANPPPNPILNSQVPGGIAQGVFNLSLERDRLVSQLQAEYTQRLGDFTAQNNNLQSQVQALNTRVAAMENEINQLVRALTQTQAKSAQTLHRAPAERSVESASTPHINYNVQAIIPGRAWLRSPNGETITVAEGDLIKNIGRVTKIDPYDGIVEINTGVKTITLSYGSGG